MTRISERDLVIPALAIAVDAPDGYVSTTDLSKTLRDIFLPEGEDAKPLLNRNDEAFDQVVRNLISHRTSNFIARGYADYVDDGIRITDKGRALLSDL